MLARRQPDFFSQAYGECRAAKRPKAVSWQHGWIFNSLSFRTHSILFRTLPGILRRTQLWVLAGSLP